MESNFSFLEDNRLYERSAAYRRIAALARGTEGYCYADQEVFCLYARKTLEALCAFLEYTERLPVHGPPADPERRDLAVYLSRVNHNAFLPAIGGNANYLLLGEMEGRLERCLSGESWERSEIVLGLYRLLVWFYRRCGGERMVLISEFSEASIPIDLGIDALFGEDAPTADDRAYLDQFMVRRNEVRFIKGENRDLVEYGEGGRMEEAVPAPVLSRSARQDQSVEHIRDTAKALYAVLSRVREEFERDAMDWERESQKVLEELRHLRHIHAENAVLLELETLFEADRDRRQEGAAQFRSHAAQTLDDLERLAERCGKNVHLDALNDDLRDMSGRCRALHDHSGTERPDPALTERLTAIIQEPLPLEWEKLLHLLMPLQVRCELSETRYQENLARIEDDRARYRRKFEETDGLPRQRPVQVDPDAPDLPDRPEQAKRSVWKRLAVVCAAAALFIAGLFLIRGWVRREFDAAIQNGAALGAAQGTNVLPPVTVPAPVEEEPPVTEPEPVSEIEPEPEPDPEDLPHSLLEVPNISRYLMEDLTWLAENESGFAQMMESGVSEDESVVFLGRRNVPGGEQEVAALSERKAVQFAYRTELNGEICTGIALEPSALSGAISRETSLAALRRAFGEPVSVTAAESRPTDFAAELDGYQVVRYLWPGADAPACELYFIYDSEGTEMVDYAYILFAYSQIESLNRQERPIYDLQT